MSSPIEWLRVTLKKFVNKSDKQGYLYFRSRRQLRNEILAYYATHPTADKEISEALLYLKKHFHVTPYPYPFIDKYKVTDIAIDTDESEQSYYTYPDGKRLFIKRGADGERAQALVNQLLIEQDPLSPHRYMGDGYELGADDVLADVGSAEGFLALQYVDKVKHVYLFECDPVWLEALEKTFAPWKDKVTIVRKYVSNADEGDYVSLGNYFSGRALKPTFIKLDIEGFEKAALEGMGDLWSVPNLHLDVCTYHKQEDYATLSAYLATKGFGSTPTVGYTCASLDGHKPPYFRRGMIHSKKEG